MSQFFETPTRPDTAAGAIGQYLRVKTPGALALAGASDVAIGTMETECLAAGPCTVRLRSAQGTKKMVAAGEITKGAVAYAAASGKVDGSGTVREGVALEAAAVDGDIIEVMDAPHVDLVSSGGITLPTVTFNGDTAVNKISVPDNKADALSILEGSNKYLTIVTTNASEKITASKTLELSGAIDLKFAGTTGQPEIVVPDDLADALSVKDDTGGADIMVITTTNGSEVVAFTPKVTCANGITAAAQEVTPDDSEGAGNTIKAGVTAVDVQAVTNDANDFVVLPALANVPVGHTIRIACNAGGNFELRTPADSDEKINNVNSDGAAELLCTDTEVVEITKVSDTDGWTAVSRPLAGGITAAAVTPD